MTIDPTRPNALHTCVSSTNESHISVRFARRPAVFEIQALLSCVHRMTLQEQMYPIYVLLVSPSLKFHSVWLYNKPFSRHGPFWHKCTEWSKMTLNTVMSQVPYIYVTNVPIPESQISPPFPLPPLFSRYKVVDTQKCTKNNSEWPWTLNSQKHANGPSPLSVALSHCCIVAPNVTFDVTPDVDPDVEPNANPNVDR